MLFAVLFLLSISHLQAFDSLITMSDPGTEFVPIDENIFMLGTFALSDHKQCYYACHMNYLCRVFDYDSVSSRCRLFEGDVITTGSIAISNSSSSTVGQIQLSSNLFATYGQPCSNCFSSRYLTCINSTCTCFQHTYWTGSICASQYLRAAQCLNSSQCRADLNLTCLQFFQCGPSSLLVGTTVFGNLNGSSGNTSSSLNTPWGITINDDNSILIADAYNKRIILANQSVSIAIMVLCGGGELTQPSKAMFDDTLSELYVLDAVGSRMMVWTNGSSVCMPLFGASGSNLNQLSTPYSFYRDSQHNFYIADTYNHRVLFWPMNASSGVVIAGTTGVAGSGILSLDTPTDVFVDKIQSQMYVADANNNRILRYTLGSPNGTVVAGGNGVGTARNQLNHPVGVCQSKKTGALYIADQLNHRIQRWYPGESQGVTIAGSPSGTSGNSALLFNHPNGIALNAEETDIFLSDRNNNRVQSFKLI